MTYYLLLKEFDAKFFSPAQDDSIHFMRPAPHKLDELVDDCPLSKIQTFQPDKT